MTPFEFSAVARDILPAKLAAFEPELTGASHMKRLDPLILAAVIWHESTGNPKALSFDGGHGKGLGQIDDRSFPTFCAAYWGKTNRLIVFESDLNVLACAKHLRENLDALKQDLWPAVAAYNAGAGAVRKKLEQLTFGKKKWEELSPAERYAAANLATYGGKYLNSVRGHYETFQTRFNELKRKGSGDAGSSVS